MVQQTINQMRVIVQNLEKGGLLALGNIACLPGLVQRMLHGI
jgi:hypothetical protein